MSAYKVRFYVSTGYRGSEKEEVLDLVEDLGYTEQEAQKRIDNDMLLQDDFEEWVWDNLNATFESYVEE